MANLRGDKFPGLCSRGTSAIGTFWWRHFNCLNDCFQIRFTPVASQIVALLSKRHDGYRHQRIAFEAGFKSWRNHPTERTVAESLPQSLK
jgi:hypothetical protein